jgi:Holliday junction DNA helicase RuvA
MVRPVSDIATAIEEQDLESLSSLPGIGSATAERIVAKLRRKVPKFALMVTRQVQYAADVAPDVVSETYEVLRKLGHTESDARRLLDAVLATKRKFKDVQSLIAAIYQQSRGRTPDEG